MGAVNQEDVYRVKDYQDETDKQREELRAQMQHKDAQSKEELSKLMELLSEKNARIEKLTRMINDDSSKKELEKKLAIAHDKNRALKKLVQLALEEM
jgi:predicted transcriptional regulator